MNTTFFEYRIFDEQMLSLFGFKIHISATKDNYKQLFFIVSNLMNQYKISYKYIKNDEDILFNFSTKEAIAESGKYFTIYPSTQIEFLTILEMLYQAIPIESDGVYIMSDRPYKDSKVIFYRYGALKIDAEHTENGIPLLLGPNGEKWLDYQRTYFALPSWIQDIQEEKIVEESYLGQTYTVSRVLHANNGGNIYLAACNTSLSQKVVLKEVRPNIISFGDVFKTDLRAKEFQLACRLKEHVPKAFEKVDEWINRYYIYEYIDGMDLHQYAQRLTLFGYKSGNSLDYNENREKFESFLQIVKKLLEIFTYFHGCDYIVNDVHGYNFIVTEEKEIVLIDLEHGYFYEEEPLSGVYNDVSLKKWNNINGKVADCHKVGNLLLYLLGRLQIKDCLKDELNILNELLAQYGIKSNLCDVIEYLLSETAEIEVALEMMKKIGVDSTSVHEANVQMLDNTTIFIHSNSAIELAKRINQSYSNYCMDSEKNFGLEGLAGSLMLMQANNVNHWLLDYGVQRIKDRLVKTDTGLMTPLDRSKASPYLNNGQAGVIKLLLYLNKEKWKGFILQLAESLQFEYAQFAGYEDGMLGISDVLIEVYELSGHRIYLYRAGKLLRNCAIYANYGYISKSDYHFVAARYLKEVVI